MKRILILVIVTLSGSSLVEAARHKKPGNQKAQRTTAQAQPTEAMSARVAVATKDTATQTPQRPCAYLIPAEETLPLNSHAEKRIAELQRQSTARRLTYNKPLKPQECINLEAFVKRVSQYSQHDMRRVLVQLLNEAQKARNLDAKVKEILAAFSENTPQNVYNKVSLLARIITAEIKHRDRSVYFTKTQQVNAAKKAALVQRGGLLGLGVLGL